ncbi:long-chain fatty-acid-CoA ligase [Tirmania nivea]|nr:long-chain fatty-acid-CoA ligase [Tirmania nivea]
MASAESLVELPTYPLDTRPFPEPYCPARIPPIQTDPPPYGVPVTDSAPKDGETPPYRHPKRIGKDLITVFHSDPTVNTTFNCLVRAKDKWPNRLTMGTRKVLSVHHEDRKGKNWTMWELGDYEYMTFKELWEEVKLLGSSLIELGLEKNGRVGIYMQTCAKWFQTSLASHSQSLTIVTAYDTLGPAALAHSLNSTSTRILVTEARLLPSLIKVFSSTPHITHIIYTTDYGEADPSALTSLQSLLPNAKFLSWTDFRVLGAASPHPLNPPTPDLDACIMYTSGSTGTPKGVCLTHANVIAGIAAANYVLEKFLTPQDRLLAYLPLAHIVEFAFEHCSLYWGATLGYGRPQTLTPAGGSLVGKGGNKNDPNIKGDIEFFAPTVMVGVPAVWETVKKGIVNKVAVAGAIKKNLFYGALAARRWGYSSPRPGILGKLAVGIADTVVFNGIRKLLGGNLRAALSGAAKLNPETSTFLTHVLGAPIVKGYAMTETTGLLALMVPDQWEADSDGAIAASSEVKLVSFPEAGYSVLDKPNPRGEIWILGGNVSRGYFGPEGEAETKEAWIEDERGRWLMTGDIGEFEFVDDQSKPVVETNGREWYGIKRLRVIDRKKNLVKTSKGEYVALEKLEAFYRSTPVVGNLCVMASSDCPKPLAVVYPVPAQLRKLATSLGKDGQKAEYEGLLDDADVNSAVLKMMLEAGRSGGLNGIELLEKVVLVGPEHEEWTPENGLLTSARKVERRNIRKQYGGKVEAAFGEMARAANA